MFQDDLHSAEETAKLHQAYGRMADAVAESLRSYLWVVGELLQHLAGRLEIDFLGVVMTVARDVVTLSAADAGQIARVRLKMVKEPRIGRDDDDVDIVAPHRSAHERPSAISFREGKSWYFADIVLLHQ